MILDHNIILMVFMSNSLTAGEIHTIQTANCLMLLTCVMYFQSLAAGPGAHLGHRHVAVYRRSLGHAEMMNDSYSLKYCASVELGHFL